MPVNEGSFMLEAPVKGTLLSKLTHGLKVKIKIDESRSRQDAVFYWVEYDDPKHYETLMDRVVSRYN